MVTKFKDDFTPENITLSGKNAPPQPLKAHIEGETIVDGTKFPPQNETKLTEIVLEFECTDALLEYVRKYTYAIDRVPKIDDLTFNIELRAQESVMRIYGAMFSEVNPTKVPVVAHIHHEYFKIEYK